MALDTVSISSDDDVPLKAIGATHQPITSTILKGRSIQHCDFCEEVFLNKYDALIHNAKHIIIPLIKRELHQCPLCLFYFTSRYKLKHHTRNKHKNDIVKDNENYVKNYVNEGNKIVKLDNDKKDSEKNLVFVKNCITIGNGVKNYVNEGNKIVKLDNDKEDSEKNLLIMKNCITIGNNKSHEHNDKTKAMKETMVTKYESDDDDDLPLVNVNLKAQVTKETEKAKCGTDILREALLKDVKVVIEKIDLMPESKLSVKVPEKFELNAKEPAKIEPKAIVKMADQIEKANNSEKTKPKAVIKMPDPIEKANNSEKIEPIPIVKMPDEIENAKYREKIKPKLIVVKMPEVLTPKINPIVEPKVKIRSRLRFEDDIDDFGDAVMKDLTTDCIVDMNLFDEPWFDELAKSVNHDDIDVDIITIDDDDDETEDNRGKEADTVYSPSTHHDELIKPGVYRCRKCQQMFPTRFNQIQHEMSHMHIRKPRPVLCEHCDRFIASKKALKDHISSKHHLNYRPRTYQSCTKCGLKYNNYDRHLENYHVHLRCHLCNKGFESEIDRLNHIRGHLVKVKCGQCGFVASELEIQEHKRRFHKSFVNLVEFSLCDVCCLFLRNKQNTNYVFGETVSKLGGKLDCEHCGNKFFHVTQVRRSVRGRPADRFTFERERERKKGLTNTERLKNIQQRLKMINKLSRF